MNTATKYKRRDNTMNTHNRPARRCPSGAASKLLLNTDRSRKNFEEESSNLLLGRSKGCVLQRTGLFMTRFSYFKSLLSSAIKPTVNPPASAHNTQQTGVYAQSAPSREPAGKNLDINTNFTGVAQGLTATQEQAVMEILQANSARLEDGDNFQGLVYTGFGDEIVVAPTTIGGGTPNEGALDRVLELMDTASPDFMLTVGCGWTCPGMGKSEVQRLLRKHGRYANMPGAQCNVMYILETNSGVYDATAALMKTHPTHVRRVFTPTQPWQLSQSKRPCQLQTLKLLKSIGVL
jgi:hypothetical protein